MRGMILAAGRGERMGALTQQTPKPLLKVASQYLIQYAIASLRTAGIHEIVINISYEAQQIKTALGDGSRFGVNLVYSEESERLETGGGIVQALPLLGEQPFVVMSSDIITDYPLKNLPQHLSGLAHLVMVTNPAYHLHGDFGLQREWLTHAAKPTLTYANFGVFHPDLFAGCNIEPFRLANLLHPAIAARQITGEHYQGKWLNIGTAQDLAAADDDPLSRKAGEGIII